MILNDYSASILSTHSPVKDQKSTERKLMWFRRCWLSHDEPMYGSYFLFCFNCAEREICDETLYSPLLCKSVPLGCSSRHFWKCSLVHLPAHQNQSLQSLSHQILRWFHPRSIRDRCATLYSNSSWKNDVDTIFNLKPINKGKNGIKHDSNKRTGIFKGNKI